MHHVGEGHHVQELAHQPRVVHVAIDDEDPVVAEEGLAGLLQRLVVVVVEVVEPNDAVSTLLQRERHVRPNETGSTGNQDGHAAGSVDLGGRADLLLPLDATPGGRQVPASGIDKTLETQIRRREGDQEERPQEHGASGSKTAVELTVHGVGPLDLELPRR